MSHTFKFRLLGQGNGTWKNQVTTSYGIIEFPSLIDALKFMYARYE